ncbi:hypothetical protein MACK_001029 [Theileria orientalis]|uniref:Inositol polyphosphate-related phosphatase domain-containing protein n=1 Tax=Theileria orientalis TaxID=68886 RepID=A0A976MC89_THEOR|nr:hypothetical protein MACK_001029 [Theileria orientalis]
MPYILSCYGSIVNETTSSSSGNIDPDNLVLLTYSGEESSENFEPSKYIVTKFVKFGCLTEFTITEDSRCSEVRYGPDLIWKHDPDKNGDIYPSKVVLNSTARVVWIIFDHMYYGYFYFNDGWKLNLSKHYEINDQKPEDGNTSHLLDEILPSNIPENEDSDSTIESNSINSDPNLLSSDSSEDSHDSSDELKAKIILKRGIENELEQKESELERLAKREKELIVNHIRRRNLGIWVGSWNIGGNIFDFSDGYVDWTKAREARYEVYVFNFQEFVKLSFLNIAIGRTDERKERLFERYIQKMLKDYTKEDYFKLNSVSMTGLYQVIFAKKILKPYIRDIFSSTIKTGVYYSIGNKGSVGTQFSLFEYNFSLLNVHLNFGPNLSLRRVILLEYVLKNLFKKKDKTVMNSDFFIVSGDFNFSVLLEKPTILRLLRKMQYNKLLNYDEFNIAKINSSKMIGKLHESKINFGPTYKYRGGTRRYTTRRAPGWSDRILFGGRLLDDRKANILSYRRNDNLTGSDHRPVANVLVDSAGIIGGSYQPVYPLQQARPTQLILDDPPAPFIRNEPQFVNHVQDVQVGVRRRKVQKSNDIDISLNLLSDREEDLNMFRSQPASQGVTILAPKQSQKPASGTKTLQFPLDDDTPPPFKRNEPQFVNPVQDVKVGVRRRKVQKSNDIDISLNLLSDREEDLNMFRSQPASQGVTILAPKQSQKPASGTKTLQFPLDDDTPPPFKRNEPQFVNPVQDVKVGVRRRKVQKSNDIDISLNLLSDREEDLNMFRSQPASQGVTILAGKPSHKKSSGTKTLEINLDPDVGSEFLLNRAMPPPTQVLPTAEPTVQGRTPVGPIPLNFDEIEIAPSVDRQPLQFNLESGGSDVELVSKFSSRPMEISLDSEDESYGTPVELDLNKTDSSYEFEYTKSGANGIFIPRDGFYFSSVSENNVPLWKGEKDEYALKVVRDGIGRFKLLNNVFIYFASGVVREFSKESGMWNEKDVRVEVDDSGNPIHVKSMPRKKVAVVDEGDIYVQDGRAEEPYKSEEEEEIDDSEYAGLTGIELNLGNKYATSSYDCKKEGRKAIFTSKEGFGFRAVWYNHDKSTATAIWTAKGRSKYSNKVIYHNYYYSKMEDATVHQFNGKKRLFVKNGNTWNEVDLNKIIPVYVNIDSTSETYSFYNDHDGSCSIITPKHPFAISHLVEFCVIPYGIREVWHAKSAEEYPVKVVVEPGNIYVNSKNMNLYFKDGKIRFLTRVKGTNWVDRSNKVELYIGRPGDTIAFSYIEADGGAIYEKRNDFFITKVIVCNGLGPLETTVNIWTAKNPGEYVKRVIVDGLDALALTPRNAILFLENGVIKHMNCLNYRWIEISPSCILDISRKQSTYDYKYYKDKNNVEHFDPKYHFVFKGVKNSVGSGSSRVQVEIWDAKDPKEYAYKICLVTSGKKEKFLVIFQECGQVKIFNKYDKNRPWADHSTNRYSINDIRIAGLDIVAHRMERERAKLEEAEKIRLAEASSNAFQPFDRSQYKPAHTISERLRYAKPESHGLLQPSTAPQVEPKSEPVEVEGKNLLYLDIQKRHNIFGYTISYRDDKVIFKAVEPFLFGIVKSEGTTLWRYKGDEYPNKVLYKEVNGKPKVKVYFPDYPSPPSFVMRGPSTKFDPSSIHVEVSKCKKPGSEFFKDTVVEVSGSPATTTPEDPEDLYVAPKEPRKKQWDIDDD